MKKDSNKEAPESKRKFDKSVDSIGCSDRLIVNKSTEAIISLLKY